jgi:hypothetical protein
VILLGIIIGGVTRSVFKFDGINLDLVGQPWFCPKSIFLKKIKIIKKILNRPWLYFFMSKCSILLNFAEDSIQHK